MHGRLVAGLAATTWLAVAAGASEPPDRETAATRVAAEEAAEDGAAAAGEATWSEQIVVTASRSDRPLHEVPLHVTVVDPARPEARLDFGAAELVSRQVPSLNLTVASSNLIASPRDQSVNMRGAGGGNVSHVLLLVDGLPALDPYNSSAIWAKTPRELIERVEVVPGGGATVWGNLALSGVVNLITRVPSQRALDLAVRAAEHDTFDVTVFAADSVGRWSGWLAANAFATDGYPTVERASRGAADVAEFRDYESLNGRLRRALSDSALLELRGLAYHEDRGEGTRIDRAENEEWLAAASLDVVTNARGSLRAQAFGRRQRLDDRSGELAADRDTVELRSHIRDLTSESVGAGATWNRLLAGRGSVAAGVDLQAVTVERVEDLEPGDGGFLERSLVEGRQELVGGFLEGRWWPTARWSVQGAARFDSIRTSDGRNRRVDLVTGELLEDVRLGSNTETTFNPTLGFVFQATPASRWRGAVYSGFRSPLPSELFVGSAPRNNRVRLPNPALRPETLVGGELGYDHSPSARWAARATAFWTETEDLVQVRTLGRVGPEGGFVAPCGELGPRGSCQQRRNVGATRARGVELELDVNPHPRWSVRLASALFDAEVVDNPDDPGLVGNRLEQTAEERATLGVSYRGKGRATLGLRVRYLGTRFAEIENENRLPGFTVADLTCLVTLSPRLELLLGVENVTDEAYRIDHSSSGIFRAGPSRLLQIGLRYRAGQR